ncbi:MAG TPA: DUF4097 family beta strand repeat-containing protein [Bryobacteraceae bacterium]|nr:DUF4097 family beta strand repeat-containing protein [Bryobacteraceae bacterium]
MRLDLRVLSVACAAVLLTACGDVVLGFSGSPYQEDFHYSYPLSAQGRVTIQNFNGSVEISGWDQNNVEIDGTKYARSQQELSGLKVEIDSSADAIAIRTVRPPDYFRNGGVRYTIHVPRRAELEEVSSSNGPIRVDTIDGSVHLRTSNGPIHASGIGGNLDAATSNGPIHISDLTGRADVHTSNGPIDLTMNQPREVRAATSNGAISVHLPENSGYDVRARTSHGSITSDFDMSLRGRIARNNLDGTIGSGGPLLDLSTSNGAIRLLKL